MVIVKLEKKPRYKNVYYVYFDNGERIEVFDEFLIIYHLKVGVELSEDKIKQIQFLSQEKIGQQYCVQTLARGMKTKKELTQKLKEKGICNNEVINKILSKISSYGYLDDEKFAQNYISMQKNRMGTNKIKFELEQKGVDYKTINKYISQIENEEEVALLLAQKYMRNKENSYKNKTKLYSHLVSKGFTYEIISKVLQNFSWQLEDDKM